MGNYIGSDDLAERFSGSTLANLCSGHEGAAFDSLISKVIDRAEGMVDAMLSARYQTPVPASGFVMEAALRAAELELYGRSPGKDVPERVRKNWEDISKTLERIADGKAALPGTSAGSTSAPSSCAVLDYSDSDYSTMTRF